MDYTFIILIVLFCLVMWIVLYFAIKTITHVVNPNPYRNEYLKTEWIKVTGKIIKKVLPRQVQPGDAKYWIYSFELIKDNNKYTYKFTETWPIIYLNITKALKALNHVRDFAVGDKIDFYIDPKDYSKYYIDPKDLLIDKKNEKHPLS
jgi:hypothetical protein